MIPVQHRNRDNYENLLIFLMNKCAGNQFLSNDAIRKLSDFWLLSAIDKILTKANCIPFTPEELEMELK